MAAQPSQDALARQQMLQREPYKSFIKPEQLTPANFPPSLVAPQQLENLKNGFKTLWENVMKHPPEHALHQQAVGKLNDASKKLLTSRKEEISRRQQAQGQAPAQASSQSQQTQAQARQQAAAAKPDGNTNAQGQAAASNPQLSQDPNAQGDKHQWSLPITIVEGTPQADEYRAEASKRHAEGRQSILRTMNALKELEASVQQANKAGKQVPEQSVAERRATLQKTLAESKAFMEKMLTMDKQNKAAQLQNQARNNSVGQVPANRPQPPVSAVQGQQNRPSPVTNGSAGPTIPNTQAPHPQLPQGYPNQRPPAAPSLSHSDSIPSYTTNEAIAAAASSAARGQASPSQQTPGQPQIFDSRQMTHGDAEPRKPGNPISKGYIPQPPQPVVMGAARPTLAGPSSGPMGSMGQPAIQKSDTFLLQGPGDHVLDKKRLDELVRQVCGADAGEDDALLPEVEESVLQLADEFVDNVITSACKLAKLRGSLMLELRDIQLVLERQYNIRIPGYATDEVRTVRKTAPAPGYYQKINAVQAAKVMGGKTDL